MDRWRLHPFFHRFVPTTFQIKMEQDPSHPSHVRGHGCLPSTLDDFGSTTRLPIVRSGLRSWNRRAARPPPGGVSQRLRSPSIPPSTPFLAGFASSTCFHDRRIALGGAKACDAITTRRRRSDASSRNGGALDPLSDDQVAC